MKHDYCENELESIIHICVLSVCLHFVYCLKLQFLVWQTRFSHHTFSGHKYPIVSLDFHAKKTDLLCSCDRNGEIRYWNVTQLTYLGAMKVGTLLSDPLKSS